MSTLLYCDLSNKKLRRSLGGAEFSFGTIPHIGTITLGLRFSKQVGTRHIEIYPTISEIRATIGPLDQRPAAGQFSLKVGSGSPVVGTNVTTLLNWNATGAEIQAALRVLTGLGAAAVEEDRDTFLVTGVVATIAVYENTLRPICFVRVKSYEVGSATTQSIRLQVAPFGFTDVVEQIVPSPPTIERIQAGTEIDGTKYPEIQKLTIPLEFNGGYRLRRSDPLRKSPLLGVADGPEEIAAAINPTGGSLGLADDEDGRFVVEEHPTEPASLISFLGSMLGDSPEEIEVEVFDPPPADHWLHLNPQTAMTEEALRDTNLIRRVPVEFHADLAIDGMDEKSYCLYRGECSIQEAVTHNDLGTLQHVDWINPPDAKSYPPVSVDSIAEGARFYPFLLGNGSDIEFQKTHSLASPRIRVNLRENATGGRELIHGTDFEYVHDNNDACTITLLGTYASSLPALNGLTGTVQDLTLTSTWLSPVVPIANVTGLQALLDAILAELAALRAGNFGGAAPVVSTMTGKIDRPLPRVWAIPRSRALPIDPGNLFGWNPFGEGSTLRDIRLLPAVHLDESEIEALPTLLPTPSLDYRDRVFYSAIDRDDIVGGMKVGQFAACDGREWYRVVREVDSLRSWYPAIMGVELFRLSISPDELARRTRLDLALGIEMALFDPSRRPSERRTVGRMRLLLERGVRTVASGSGANIIEHFADPVILARHDFDLTAVPMQKHVSLSIARSGSDVLTAHAGLFLGSPTIVSAPETADFSLRLRIGGVDFEDLPVDGRGVFALRGPDIGLDGQTDNNLGRWKIS